VDHNPNGLADLFNRFPPYLIGVLMAMVVGALRVVYDQEETKPVMVVLESLICGSLSLVASSGILAMGLDMTWSVFVGGIIGYLGSNTTRAIALKLINKNVSKK